MRSQAASRVEGRRVSWVAGAVLAAVVPALIGPTLVMHERTAYAQGADDAATVEARKRFQEGVALFDQKKYDLASVAFMQAYTLKKHPAVLINLATSELRAGKPFDAAQHFKEFLKNPATQNDPKRPEAEAGLTEARQKLGRIQITVDLPDADVSLDGNRVGSSPLGEPFDVLPGSHQLEARKEGKRAQTTVTAVEGKIVVADLKFNADLPPPAASVTVPVPVASAPPPATTQAPPPPPPVSEPHEYHSTAPWTTTAVVGGGVAGVGLVLGVAFLVAGNSAQSNANSTRDRITGTITSLQQTDPSNVLSQRAGNPCATPVLNAPKKDGSIVDFTKACSNLKNDLNTKNTDRTVETVGFVAFGIGAAALITGLVGRAIVSKNNEDAPATSLVVTPIHTADMNGFGLSGRF